MLSCKGVRTRVELYIERAQGCCRTPPSSATRVARLTSPTRRHVVLNNNYEDQGAERAQDDDIPRRFVSCSQRNARTLTSVEPLPSIRHRTGIDAAGARELGCGVAEVIGPPSAGPITGPINVSVTCAPTADQESAALVLLSS